MQLPAYFLSQPAADWGIDTIASFERLYQQNVEHGKGALIDYTLPAPKWQFLCYLCNTKRIVVHGSGNPDIAEFEPRKSNDALEFGNRRAVYAASDGIWPIYFAIVDRDHGVTSLVNSCFRVDDADGQSQPYYYFSINADALPHHPWRTGTIYLLPGDSFEQQPRQRFRGFEIDVAQWASLTPVKPLAKLAVIPEDFPFLSQIQPHDWVTLQERAKANPDGFPWQDEERIS